MQPGMPMHPGMPTMAPPPVMGGISQEQRLELLEYWRSVLERKWAIAALAVAVGVLAPVVAMGLPSVYRATTLVLVEAHQVNTSPIEAVYRIDQPYERYQTQVELLKSRAVALRTAKQVKLWNHPLQEPRVVKPTWRDRAMASVGIGVKREIKTNGTDDELVQATVGVVQDGLSITPVRGSQLIRMRFDSQDRELAAKMANVYAHEYFEAGLDERYKLTQQVSKHHGEDHARQLTLLGPQALMHMNKEVNSRTGSASLAAPSAPPAA